MTKRSLRNQLGYGSTYRKGGRTDVGAAGEISSVLGGQVWLIKPDKEAKSANPCIWMQAGVVKNKDCNNYYDCTTCKYDHGMRLQVDGVTGVVEVPVGQNDELEPLVNIR